MIKSNQCLLTFIFFFFFHGANAQKSQQESTVPNTITQQQFDSLYHALMTAKYPEYADWKKGLPKRKRKIFLKHAIAGFLAGSLVGAALSQSGSAFCEAITIIPNNVLLEPDGQSCQPQFAKAMLISGGIGLILGITAGQIKSKKISRFRPTILY